MTRIARVVAPGFPHHVTQRGNRRQRTFFHDEDYQTYIRLMGEWCSRLRVNFRESWRGYLGAYKWSSAKTHREGLDDELVKVSPLLNRPSAKPGFEVPLPLGDS